MIAINVYLRYPTLRNLIGRTKLPKFDRTNSVKSEIVNKLNLQEVKAFEFCIVTVRDNKYEIDEFKNLVDSINKQTYKNWTMVYFIDKESPDYY